MKPNQEDVSPPRDTPLVVREDTLGGGQHQDRAVELEAENAQLRAQIKQLMEAHEFDREVLRAIRGNADLALRREAS